MRKIFNITFMAVTLIAGADLAAEVDDGSDDLHSLTMEHSPVDDIPTKKLSDRAFEALLEDMFPTTPSQLKEIQRKENQYNNVIYDNKQPRALTDIIPVSTKPGAKPVVIYVAPFHTTTINIIDTTGQPWPITAVMYGNSADYKATKVDGHKYANIVRIDPKREVGTTNINLTLVDLATSITITMRNSTDQYHPSPVLQIDKEGPQAKPLPVFSIDNTNSDKVLKNIVLGIAPDHFETLKTSDSNVEAWRSDGSLYIRTTYHPSSPLPRGVHHGPAGYKAYRMNDIPVLVMTTDEGYEKKIMTMESDI